MVTCKLYAPKLQRSDGLLNLHQMARHLPNVEYEPQRLPALRLRIKSPIRATFLLYSSGSVICTGARCERDARSACGRLKRLIQCLDRQCQIRQFKVRNLVCNARLPHSIDLEATTTRLANPNRATFNPELFAGMIYTCQPHPHVRALVFRNGKLIITGARSEDELAAALKDVIENI